MRSEVHLEICYQGRPNAVRAYMAHMRTYRASVRPCSTNNANVGLSRRPPKLSPILPLLQVSGNAAVIRFQFATKPMTAAAAKDGFLSCLLPHHVDAGATGKVVLKVNAS